MSKPHLSFCICPTYPNSDDGNSVLSVVPAKKFALILNDSSYHCLDPIHQQILLALPSKCIQNYLLLRPLPPLGAPSSLPGSLQQTPDWPSTLSSPSKIWFQCILERCVKILDWIMALLLKTFHQLSIFPVQTPLHWPGNPMQSGLASFPPPFLNSSLSLLQGHWPPSSSSK